MTDIDIARKVLMDDIISVSKRIGIDEDNLILYGKYKAKIDGNSVFRKDSSKLILVTSINPTIYGEGKTTVSIGLADGLKKLDKNVMLALREPSMGPVFGVKGGATGGGYSQVIPMEDINLSFTGDFAAIESANNLLCASIDNHIINGNSLGFNRITFNRCLDVNDKSLREVTTIVSKTNFDITAASEIMALLCLSKNIEDLKERLGNIIVGYNKNNEEIFARDLHIEGAMTVLLKDALKPNLVQTLEHTPAIIHGGPFANIAHGCNSIVATNTALHYADYVVTEAGFGSDLGAEKFFDIKCRIANLKPDCVVIVVTVKALKHNAGVVREKISTESVEKVEEGLENLRIHIENMFKYNSNVVVTLNRYDTDSDEEILVVKRFCEKIGVPYEECSAYLNGSNGSVRLGQLVLNVMENDNKFKLLYENKDTIFNKIEKISREIYRSSEVVYTDEARSIINELQDKGYGRLPICIAKTQYSISDDSKALLAPIGNVLHVKDVKVYNGAGFITVITGSIMTMPGLSKTPNYERIDYVNGKIVGLS